MASLRGISLRPTNPKSVTSSVVGKPSPPTQINVKPTTINPGSLKTSVKSKGQIKRIGSNITKTVLERPSSEAAPTITVTRKTVETVLTNLVRAEIISQEEANFFKDLKLGDGSLVLSLTNSDSFMEVISIYKSFSNNNQQKMLHLASNSLNLKEMIFNAPNMSDAAARFEAEKRLYRRRDRGIQSGEPCPKCGGDVYFNIRQVRSADEAPTVFFRCVQCKNKWKTG